MIEEPFISAGAGMSYVERREYLTNRTYMDDYIEIDKPYMTKEVVESFIFELKRKFKGALYWPTPSDVWLVKTLGLDENDLPPLHQYKFNLEVHRPKEIEDKINLAYRLLDNDDFAGAKELLKDIPSYDTDSVRINSCIEFMEP